MKNQQFISVTPLEQLHRDFIPAYEEFIEYGKVTVLFIAVAGVVGAVIKSSRN